MPSKTDPSINVKINSKNLDVGRNATMSKEEAIEQARNVIDDLIAIHPAKNVSAEIVLDTEGAEHDPVQKVRIKLTMDGKTIVQAAHSRSIKKALDRAQNDLESQVRKMKARRTEIRQKARRASMKRYSQRMNQKVGDANDFEEFLNAGLEAAEEL